MDKVNLEISWTTLWRIFFFGLLVLLMFLGRQILVALFIALIISSGVEVIVDLLEKRGIPRILGAILVFFLFITLIVGVLYTIVPIAVVNLNTLLLRADKSVSALGGKLTGFSGSESLRIFSDLINNLTVQAFSNSISPLAFLSQILGGLTLVVSIFIISFYLSLSHSGIENFIRALLPADYEEAGLKIYGRSRKKIGRWLRAQVLLSLVIGFLVWLALLILGVKYPVLLGVVAGTFELVPFVGPILAGGLSVLTAFTTSLPLAFYTLIVFLALQQFESNVLVPLLMRRAVGLHPVIVIVALLMGIEISGFVGAIMAVPAAAIIQEIAEEWGSRKISRASA